MPFNFGVKSTAGVELFINIAKSYVPLNFGVKATARIDRSITQTINLKNNRFNHKHWHAPYCFQLACGEILTVIDCYDKQIVGIRARYGSVHWHY